MQPDRFIAQLLLLPVIWCVGILFCSFYNDQKLVIAIVALIVYTGYRVSKRSKSIKVKRD
jgi:hypothetical protein